MIEKDLIRFNPNANIQDDCLIIPLKNIVSIDVDTFTTYEPLKIHLTYYSEFN